MIQSLATAAAGLSAQQQKIDIIANNISNVNTAAYKSTDARFKDTLYTAMENPDLEAQEANLQKGTGVALASTDVDFTQGSVISTGNPLDLMINGDGFFELMTASGEVVYSKNGAFTVSSEEDGGYLVNSQGDYVLDADGDKILVPEGASEFIVQSDGRIIIDGTQTQQLGIYTFENTQGLLSVGDSCFSETAASGEAVAASDCTVTQGALEGSNVNLASELTRLIEAQRVFSLASQALQTADDMEGLANNIRR